MTAAGHIEITDLCKEFGEVVAVNHIDLDMAGGEFFSLLGPSGCGKTTTLRMIAGFEDLTSGQIVLDGVDLRNTPPHKRPVNTVFQSYMIFPHLDVYENVAFGLRRQHLGVRSPSSVLAEALELVQLRSSRIASPRSCPVGSSSVLRLRVRWCFSRPSCCLMSRWARWTRSYGGSCRWSSRRSKQRIGITFVYVTHDQEEALR